MKTVLIAELENTNVEIVFESDGKCLFLSGKPFGAGFENERDYLNGVLDTLQAFTRFKVTYIEQ